MYRNLWKSHSIQGKVVNVLVKTEEPIKSQAMMFKVLLKAVLLYGTKIWVVMDTMMTMI